MPKGVYVRTETHRTAISARMMGNQFALGNRSTSGHHWTLTPKQKANVSAAAKQRMQTSEGKANQVKMVAASMMPEARDKTAGENHYRWQGGISFDYGLDWPAQRKLALERDNHTCQDCGKTKEELDQELDVHHKVPYRETQDNSLNNLKCLCRSCHAKTECSREVK